MTKLDQPRRVVLCKKSRLLIYHIRNVLRCQHLSDKIREPGLILMKLSMTFHHSQREFFARASA